MAWENKGSTELAGLSTEAYRGELDELSLWTRALTQADIATIQQGQIDTTDGFLAGYSIDDVIMVASGKLNGDYTNGFPISASNVDKSLGGVTYVVFGKNGQAPGQLDLASLNGTNGFKISAGNTVNQAGDINGDGVNDLIIGLPNAGQSSTIGTSAAYVIFGRTSKNPFPALFDPIGITADSGFRIDGDNQDTFAATVAGIGDFNGDGFGDLVISKFHESSSGEQNALAFVVFGAATNDILNDPQNPGTKLSSLSFNRLNGENSRTEPPAALRPYGFTIVAWNGRSGVSLNGAGDLNGDGLNDVAIGSGLLGTSYVVFGGIPADLQTRPAPKWSGEMPPVFKQEYQFVDEGEYRIQYVLSDRDGGFDSREQVIKVTNVAPVASLQQVSPPANGRGGLSKSPVTVGQQLNYDARTTGTVWVTVVGLADAVSINIPPTLDPLVSLSIPLNSAAQTVNLSGITAGNGEAQYLRITASSSNPAVVANPTTLYDEQTIPTTGQLRFTPLALGSTVITVTVFDAGWDNQFGNDDDRSFSRTFSVNVVNVVNELNTWHNDVNPVDVDADGFVSPLDVLLIINYINRGGATQLPSRTIKEKPFLDVNNDGLLGPVDALIIINYINRGNGEGESPAGDRLAELAPRHNTMNSVRGGMVPAMAAPLNTFLRTGNTDLNPAPLMSQLTSAISPSPDGHIQRQDTASQPTLMACRYDEDLDESETIWDGKVVDLALARIIHS